MQWYSALYDYPDPFGRAAAEQLAGFRPGAIRSGHPARRHSRLLRLAVPVPLCRSCIILCLRADGIERATQNRYVLVFAAVPRMLAERIRAHARPASPSTRCANETHGRRSLAAFAWRRAAKAWTSKTGFTPMASRRPQQAWPAEGEAMPPVPAAPLPQDDLAAIAALAKPPPVTPRADGTRTRALRHLLFRLPRLDRRGRRHCRGARLPAPATVQRRATGARATRASRRRHRPRLRHDVRLCRPHRARATAGPSSPISVRCKSRRGPRGRMSARNASFSRIGAAGAIVLRCWRSRWAARRSRAAGCARSFTRHAVHRQPCPLAGARLDRRAMGPRPGAHSGSGRTVHCRFSFWLALPVLFLRRWIYHWPPGDVHADVAAYYLNPPFFDAAHDRGAGRMERARMDATVAQRPAGGARTVRAPRRYDVHSRSTGF